MTAPTLPVGYPAELVWDALAADGVAVHVRPIVPDDATRLVQFHERLSPETVYRRFFSAHPHLREREVERFTRVDYQDRLAFVVERDGQLVAVARYDRLAGTCDAEVAFVVSDAEQGRGLGTILLEHLAAAAAHRGITRFVAETLASNATMQAVFRNAGFPAEQHFEDGVVKVTFPIEATSEFVKKVEARAHTADRRSIEALLRPRSVRLMTDGGPEGTALLRNIRDGGYNGDLSSGPAGDAADEADLVIVDLPTEQTIACVDAVTLGARAVAVLSRGFAEAGPEQQFRLVAAGREHGLRVLGPDSIGLINTDPAVSLNVSQAPMPRRGNVALLSQSGKVGLAALAEARRCGLGLSSFVSVGTKADVSTNDLLEYWEDDDATQVICLYVESFGNPRRFARVARRVARTKPIIALKGACTPTGRRAAAAHGALNTTADVAVDALLAGAGVIRVATLTELFDTALLLGHQPLPGGRRVAVVTTSGGAGVLAADACATAGLELPELGTATGLALSGSVTSVNTTANPIHIAEQLSDAWEAALDAVLADPEIDAVIAIAASPDDDRRTAFCAAVPAAADRSGKPVLACVLGEETLLPPIAGRRVPCFAFPERAAVALAHAAARHTWCGHADDPRPIAPESDRPRGADLVAKVLSDEPRGRCLDTVELRELLDAYGLRFDPDHEPGAAARPGFNLSVTITNDPTFGPFVSAGLGDDVAILTSGRAHRSLPMASWEAAELVDSIPGIALIPGSLDEPSADRSALRQAILRIALLATEQPEVVELGLNPLKASSSGVIVTGGYARVGRRPATEPWLRHLS